MDTYDSIYRANTASRGNKNVSILKCDNGNECGSLEKLALAVFIRNATSDKYVSA